MSTDLKFVVAPMISQSDAPFRTLCLQNGSTCAYTEMLYSERIIKEIDYLQSMIPCQDHLIGISRPLVVQICGNNPEILSKAVEMILNLEYVDGIDFNLGCPQDKAKNELFGSYLLDKCHWNNVFDCVRAMSEVIDNKINFSCKIRICEGENKLLNTIEFCKGLHQNGVNVICIHGRTRGSVRHRRAGSADIDLIQRVAEYFQDKIKIIANGNVTTPDDINKNMTVAYNCVGIMSGEGILADPAIFLRANDKNYCKDRHSLFEEYCKLSNLYLKLGGWDIRHVYVTDSSSDESPISRQVSVARMHLTYMLGKSGHGRTIRFVYYGNYLKHFHLLKDLNNSKCLDDLLEISKKCLVGVLSSKPYSPN